MGNVTDLRSRKNRPFPEREVTYVSSTMDAQIQEIARIYYAGNQAQALRFLLTAGLASGVTPEQAEIARLTAELAEARR